MKPLVGFVTLMLLCSTMIMGQTNEEGSIGYPALREVSYNYYGGSARAMGMGYAYVGVSNDVSGGLWNPAGLWILESPMVSASYSQYSPAGVYDDSLSPGTTKNNLNLSGIGHFSFVAPVRIKGHPWVFTFNFNRNNEYTLKKAWLSDLASGLNPDTYYEDEGFQRTFNFGAGTRVYKQLSFGFTLNIFDASRVNQITSVAVRDTIIDPVYGTIGALQEKTDAIDSTKSNGFNFNLGLMWKQEKYSIGAAVHTPYTITHTTNRTFDSLSTLNNLVNVDYTSTKFVVDSVAKQGVPLSVIVGAGIFPNEKLTISADFSYQNYGSTKWSHRTAMFIAPNGERTDTYEEIPIDWNNTAGLGVGAEYMIDSKFGRIPLRIGFRYDQLPQSATTSMEQTDVGWQYDAEEGAYVPYQLASTRLTFTSTGRQRSTSASVGSGIHWAQLDLDFSYMLTTGAAMRLINTTYIYDENEDGAPMFVRQGYDRITEIKSHEFRFTMTGHF